MAVTVQGYFWWILKLSYAQNPLGSKLWAILHFLITYYLVYISYMGFLNGNFLELLYSARGGALKDGLLRVCGVNWLGVVGKFHLRSTWFVWTFYLLYFRWWIIGVLSSGVAFLGLIGNILSLLVLSKRSWLNLFTLSICNSRYNFNRTTGIKYVSDWGCVFVLGHCGPIWWGIPKLRIFVLL